MSIKIRRLKQALSTGFKLKCPSCGQGALYRSFFRMHHHCPNCGLVFEREQGYFIGAIYINLVAIEILLVIISLGYYLLVSDIDQTILTILYVMGGALPFVFFRYSRSLWLSIDHFIDPPKSETDRRS